MVDKFTHLAEREREREYFTDDLHVNAPFITAAAGFNEQHLAIGIYFTNNR